MTEIDISRLQKLRDFYNEVSEIFMFVATGSFGLWLIIGSYQWLRYGAWYTYGSVCEILSLNCYPLTSWYGINLILGWILQAGWMPFTLLASVVIWQYFDHKSMQIYEQIRLLKK